MPRYTITGPIGPEALDYPLVPGVDPLDALLTVHCDGLGPRAVRLVDGAFCSPTRSTESSAQALVGSRRWR